MWGHDCHVIQNGHVIYGAGPHVCRGDGVPPSERPDPEQPSHPPPPQKKPPEKSCQILSYSSRISGGNATAESIAWLTLNR